MPHLCYYPSVCPELGPHTPKIGEMEHLKGSFRFKRSNPGFNSKISNMSRMHWHTPYSLIFVIDIADINTVELSWTYLTLYYINFINHKTTVRINYMLHVIQLYQL